MVPVKIKLEQMEDSGGFHSRNNCYQEWQVYRGCVPVALPPRCVTGEEQFADALY